MSDDTKKFVESLSPHFEYMKNGFFPYLGNIDMTNLTPMDIVRLIYDKGFTDGTNNGKREKINEIKQVLDIETE